MLLQFTMNGVNQKFDYTPTEKLICLEIRTSGLEIPIHKYQTKQIKDYLFNLVELLDEDEGIVIYNGVINYKKDINIECLIN